MSEREELLRRLRHPAATCDAEGWHDGNEFWCTLPEDHQGKHADLVEGWEW